jgi:hypothetical protein
MSAISSVVRARRQYRALRLDVAEQASRIWRAQHVSPVADPGVLAADIRESDAELEDFLADS